ncbi:MAG: glycoside hydrolase family 5 protein [Lachnospiraceae bacterium]|nr:glycoside hydrolase family 5 protein [Lachnospiraceae bacterium]
MAAEVESKTESITEPEEVKDTVAIKTTEEAETTAEGMVTIIGESKKLNVPSITGALHVEGTKLMGSNGEEVQLRGISTHGIAWFPDYINEECFRQLRNEWNVNVVRLALYTAEYNGYCTGGDREYLKNLIRNGVNYAKEQDMYVIVDWHILSDSNPNIYLNEAKEFFQEISAEYADSSHIIYEICNEPNGGTTWQDIKSYAKEVIGVIRANDEDAVILVGTPNWSQYVDQAAADPITEYNNLMYTLHFYAATHTDDLRNKMVSAIESGLPIFVSEYGICDASGSGAINEEQANLWVEQMDNYGISYVAWNMSNKNETSAIIQNWCNKTNNFSLEELSAAGQWLYKTLTKN